MDIKTIFERLDLAKHADSVYLVLQKQGPLHVTNIAKAVAAHRPAIYAALDDLLKHNFVSMVQKGKRTFYQSANPRLIAKEFAKVSNKVIAKIEAMPVPDAYSQKDIRVLSGRKGIQDAFDDIIDHTPRGDTFYRYTSERNLDSVNSYLSKDYRARRDAKKLERLVISNPESGGQKRPRLERFIRYIPSQNSLFDHNVIQTIYGDRVSFIDLNTEKVIIIENKALAEFQRTIFKQLYKKL